MTKELAALIEQLRHACAVALGDLLVLSMPMGVPTANLLQEAIVAAEQHLLETP